jgi:catechol 2,3-dioxygenase-like lactoylglutathione lyase family enzyme
VRDCYDLSSSAKSAGSRSLVLLGMVLAAMVWPVIMFVCAPANAQTATHRPRILGIAGVRILVSELAASKAFYSKLLPEDRPCVWCGQGRRTAYSVNEFQFVELSPIRPPFTTMSPPGDLIDDIVFATDDLAGMRRYLVARHVRITTPPVIDLEPSATSKQNSRPKADDQQEQPFINALDPESHRIAFVQLPAEAFKVQPDSRSKRLIHTGFVVKDAAAEDQFYKEILGFHLYWHGGMKDGEDNWVDMQVPDGTDWIEYMLKVPDNASHKTLGVMNHLAIGVNDIEVAAYAAQKNGISGTEEPKIGRDGKWQLNLYDPDETRVELMEFKPTKEPCCSAYSGPHPGP